MNSSMKQEQTHRHREQICGCQEGGREEMEWEVGVSRCKLLYVEWINNRVLLYSPGNCIQYPGINYNGKNMKKNVCVRVCVCACVCVCVCVCVTESCL